MLLEPTQLSTITLFPITILHSYYKQNDIGFYLWFLVLLSSVLWHFKKFDVPRAERPTHILHRLDVSCVCILNIGSMYEIYRNTEYTLYYATTWALYGGTLATFIYGGMTQTLMNDPDERIAEWSHAIWHIFPTLVANLYLVVYEKKGCAADLGAGSC